MPSTIPYDPSLVLGSLVHPNKLKVLTQIDEAQRPADAAEDELNSLISLRRSLDMTIQELKDMVIDPKDVQAELVEVNKRITKAATDYAKAKVTAEKTIQPLKASIGTIDAEIESPIDYNQSAIKQLPLSADSFKMNVQYFAFDKNTQDSQTYASQISAFVSDQVDDLGEDFKAEVSTTVNAQTNSQHARHEIVGTLVISITCTHKTAAVWAPFIIDVDKAVRAWNTLYPSEMINPTDPSSIAQIAKQAYSLKDPCLSLLSGATFGSCFIGMVHVLNVTDTKSSEEMYSLATKVQDQFTVGLWFAQESGGLGVDASFSGDTKNLLSAQNITSHCTLVVMGLIPSIKSNNVQMSVKGFADDDGNKSMAAIEKLQNATATEADSVDASAAAARTGGQLVAMKNAQIKGTLSAMADIDNQQNKMIDTNSMIDAMDDYVQQCRAGNMGVPINYYLKPIYRSQLAQMWVAKYYPGRYLAISGDDSKPAGGSTQAPPSSS